MKRVLGIAVLLLTSVQAYAAGKIDAGIGGVFYGDTAGLTASAVYSRSLTEWAALFGMTPREGFSFASDFSLGAGATFNYAAANLSLLVVNFEVQASYRFRFGENSPLSLYPYVNLGSPLNIFSVNGASAVNGGFMAAAGLKAGFLATPALETGIGFEYQADLTGMYIGSAAVYLYASIRPRSGMDARAISR